tara:strand:+ start:2892 stop:3077 length:186 start_codon:yes stop_codon:yes gene_type:complete
MPYLLAASITSESRIDPPGCITDVIPPAAAMSMLSAKGIKASEANAEPLEESPAILRAKWH